MSGLHYLQLEGCRYPIQHGNMPFYEYRPLGGQCAICNGKFQDLQKMSDPPHQQCPECLKPCERLISKPMISIRGALFRASERTEIDAFNRQAFEEKKSAMAKSPGHAHHDCAALGCFSKERNQELDELIKQSERSREPYLVTAKKPS